MALDDELNMTREKLIDGDLEVDIPDDIDEKNLELIITLALKSYQEQVSTISFLEPKTRFKAYEVAERYLAQAKDARYKLDRLKLERERLQGKKAPQRQEESVSDGDSGEDSDTSGVSRKELMAKAAAGQKFH